jgi:c-di-GMP-binding flagellar brake protein YcgR
MVDESFESVSFSPLQSVIVEPTGDRLAGRYPTHVRSVDDRTLKLRVPVAERLYLPVGAGDVVTFRCNTLSGSYECRIEVKKRNDEGTYPTLTIPRPAKMKRIQQRTDVRVPCEIDVTLWELEEGTESIERGPIECLAVDISAGGMKLHAPEELTEGREVVMNFHLPLVDREFETVFGRVLRNFDEQAGDQYVSAVKFSGLLDSQQEAIIQYAYRRQIKLKREGRWINE